MSATRTSERAIFSSAETRVTCRLPMACSSSLTLKTKENRRPFSLDRPLPPTEAKISARGGEPHWVESFLLLFVPVFFWFFFFG